MASVKNAYGTNNQALTITLNALANATGSYGAGRNSTAVDNTSNLWVDALLTVKAKTGSTTPANDKCVYVYGYGTTDGGASYTDGTTGIDAAFTGTNPPNMRLIGIINVAATATVYTGGPWSVANAFGGILPDHWGIYVVNFTGGALDASAGGSADYQGVYATVA